MLPCGGAPGGAKQRDGGCHDPRRKLCSASQLGHGAVVGVGMWGPMGTFRACGDTWGLWGHVGTMPVGAREGWEELWRPRGHIRAFRDLRGPQRPEGTEVTGRDLWMSWGHKGAAGTRVAL